MTGTYNSGGSDPSTGNRPLVRSVGSPATSTPRRQGSDATRRRSDLDVCRLAGKYKVNFVSGTKEFLVVFEGPSDTMYQGGLWIIRISLPVTYPFASPSVGFVNKIYHPNIDEGSGSVCLDVINQRWSSIFDLCHIFDHFLPQLLQEPNNSDPLNQIAAQHFCKDNISFKNTVKEYIHKYAKDSDIVKGILDNCPSIATANEIYDQIKDLETVKSFRRSASFDSNMLIPNKETATPAARHYSLCDSIDGDAITLQSSNEAVDSTKTYVTKLVPQSGELDDGAAIDCDENADETDVMDADNDSDEGSLSSLSEYVPDEADDDGMIGSDRTS